MPVARIIERPVYEDAGATLVARVKGHTAALLLQSTVSSIVYTVYDITGAAAVSGHNAASLTVSAVIFDTLQADDLWEDIFGDTDTLGYNYKHALAASAFPTGNLVYRYEATITPTSGAAIKVVANLKALGMYAS